MKKRTGSGFSLPVSLSKKPSTCLAFSHKYGKIKKIDAAMDFTHIYDPVGKLYCPDNGRPSIDPVVIFKMAMIQHIFGVAEKNSGVFHKGENKKCFAYTAQTACDKNGYVAGITVNPGNTHDSTAFYELYEIIIKRCTEIMNVVMDSAYKIPWICKRLIDDGRIPILPYKRPMAAEGFFRPYEYVYDEYYDCVICPENKVLNYLTANRAGYREFKSKSKSYQCENCPSRHRCTNSYLQTSSQKILCKSNFKMTKNGLQSKRYLGFPLNRHSPVV